MSAEDTVQVRDAFVAYPTATGTVMALRGADLGVAAGERLLVQGPNGSGKSTLLRVLTGEQAVVAGTVTVGGTPLHRLDADERRAWRARHTGVVGQHARRNLLTELDVLANVALQLRLTGTDRRSARRRAGAALAELGLEALAGRRVRDLSGGEAQRVAICAAVAHGPRLVLADEPTGELDETSAREVYALLTRIAAGGASVLLVSHDPRPPAFADRAVVVEDGRVAAQWYPGRSGVERVPDSRGWVHVPPPPRPALEPAPLRPPGDDGDAGPLLRLDGLTAGYEGRTLFAGLDLRVGPGGWVAVTGPSGSGKSTLLAVAVGLSDPLAGTVEVGDESWVGRDRSARAALRARRVTVAPQRPSLVETLTVRENLLLTVAVRRSGADVGAAAARLGLDALLDLTVDRLSGGERQRVALARCLVSGAPLLVLDEPTSQQDGVSALRVVEVLAEEVAAGRAVLAASHDPRLTERADQHLRLAGTGG